MTLPLNFYFLFVFIIVTILFFFLFFFLFFLFFLFLLLYFFFFLLLLLLLFPHLLFFRLSFAVACGDGEYIIYTALSFRNKAFGQAMEFVWSADSAECVSWEMKKCLRTCTEEKAIGNLRHIQDSLYSLSISISQTLSSMPSPLLSFHPPLQYAHIHVQIRYATRESSSSVKLFRNFKERKVLKPDFSAEGKSENSLWRMFHRPYTYKIYASMFSH